MTVSEASVDNRLRTVLISDRDRGAVGVIRRSVALYLVNTILELDAGYSI